MNWRTQSQVVLALVLALLAAPSLGQSVAQPKMVFSQEEWDFGEAWHGDQPSMTLTIRNEGDALLKLTDVKSTCGCTVVQPARYEIPPGESTTMSVTFDTNKKQGDTGSKVVIRSNDPDRPEFRFKIKGFVKHAVTREPIALTVRTLGQDPGQSGKVRLQNEMSDPFQPTIAGHNMPELDFEFVEIAPGLTYDLVGKTNKPLAAGTDIMGEVVVNTGFKREPQLKIPVSLRILGTVTAFPNVFYVKPGHPTQYDRSLRIEYYGERNLQLTGFRCERDDVTVTFTRPAPPGGKIAEQDPPPKLYAHARITLPKGEEIPAEGFWVTVLTNEPGFEELPVYVTKHQSIYDKMSAGRYTPPR